jgi:hypothetical protein
MSTTTNAKAADVRTVGKREAQQITAGLKAAGRSYAEAALTLQRAVTEAQTTNVAEVMGHPSFSAYLQATLTGVSLPKMTKDERRALVVSLYDAGLGQRVIGGIIGASAGTVNGDLAKAEAKGEAKPATGAKVTTTTDGKTRTRKARPAAEKSNGNGSRAAGSVSVRVSAAIRVTGAVKAAVTEAKAHRAQILKASATERATAAKNLRESIAQAQALLQAIEAADAPTAAKAA